jgi:hypothetical protein
MRQAAFTQIASSLPLRWSHYVELTLPPNANIFASKYQLYLPSKEELKAQLEIITTGLEEARHGL